MTINDETFCRRALYEANVRHKLTAASTRPGGSGPTSGRIINDPKYF